MMFRLYRPLREQARSHTLNEFQLWELPKTAIF